jgi:TolA-binding protein
MPLKRPDPDQELIALGKKLPFTPPSVEQVEELKTIVLARAPSPARVSTRRRWAAVGTIVAAAAIVIAVMSPVRRSLGPNVPALTIVKPTTIAENHGTVTTRGEARYTLASAAPDEIVRLTEGTLDIEVSPLQRGERFRVLTGDGEVEVRGTSFEVVARADRLERVLVRHGMVEVRPAGGAVRLLAAGEEWNAPATPTPTLTPPTPTPTPTVTPIAPPARVKKEIIIAPTAPKADPAQHDFDEGWEALRRGDPAHAAPAFRRALDAAPDGPLADDASFWLAVSYARAGDTTNARTAFIAYLDAHATSSRASEASAMLGWLLLDGGDLDGAEARFEQAAKDPIARVSDSAKSGLREVTARRAKKATKP